MVRFRSDFNLILNKLAIFTILVLKRVCFVPLSEAVYRLNRTRSEIDWKVACFGPKLSAKK